MRRQAELLALQERTCLSRTNPPPPQPPELHLCSQTRTSPTTKVRTSCLNFIYLIYSQLSGCTFDFQTLDLNLLQVESVSRGPGSSAADHGDR